VATQRVIVSVKPGYRASVRQALQAHGDLIKSDHPSIDAFSAEIHSADVPELARQPWIEGVSIDATVYPVGDQNGRDIKGNGRGRGSVTHLRETLGLSAMATTATGQGVVVAVIDSGITPSDDVSSTRITQFYDFTLAGCAATPANCKVAPFDDFGHGTHIAGLIGSSGLLSNNLFQGVAPGVKFVGVKVLDAVGTGTTSDVIDAIAFVIANRLQFGVQIINLSLGHPIFAPAAFDPLVRAVEQASAAGITVIIAAGNNPGNRMGYAGIMSPGNAPSAITSGAVDTKWTTSRDDDVVAAYSARGPTWFDAFAKPDVVAPGSDLISDATTDSTLYNDPGLVNGRVAVGSNAFLQLSGTSMAAAVTSGVVALLLEMSSAHAGDAPLTPNSLKAIVEYTAIPVEGTDFLTEGSGQLNAAGAIALASRINTDAKLGDWWLTVGVDPASTIGNRSYRWGQNIIWGTSVLGGDLVYRNLIIWSRNIIWGTNLIWGNSPNILWGIKQSILWDTAMDRDMPSGSFWGTNTFVKRSNIVWTTSLIWAPHLVDPAGVIGQQDVGSIIWGARVGDSLWGTLDGGNVVWGTYDGDHITWGTWDGDSITWGNTVLQGSVF
jgi:serine protease AprX